MHDRAPEGSKVNLRIAGEPPILLDRREVLTLLGQYPSCDGWLQTTDTVYARREADRHWLGISGRHKGRPLAEDAWPLDAELSVANGVSCTLRHVGNGWLWRRLEEVTGDECRVKDTQQVANWRPSGGNDADLLMVYRVYWRQQTESSGGIELKIWRPWVARFRGFTQTKQANDRQSGEG